MILKVTNRLEIKSKVYKDWIQWLSFMCEKKKWSNIAYLSNERIAVPGLKQ